MQRLRQVLVYIGNFWVDVLEMYIVASGITDRKRKKALLPYNAGQRVREIFEQLEDTGDDKDYKTAKATLKAHFERRMNRSNEVCTFLQGKQERG